MGLLDYLSGLLNYQPKTEAGRGLMEWAQNPTSDDPYSPQNVALTFSPMGLGAIKVFHGSPHIFDKFDMSKIGTGEGAQAYGHGLYFAENPRVAQDYANQLSIDRPVELKHFSHEKGYGVEDPGGSGIMWFPNEMDAKNFVRDYQMNNVYTANLRWPDPVREAADPLGPHHFLDWDRPLSEQPQALQDLVQGGPPYLGGNTMRQGQLASPNGEDIYRRLVTRKGQAAANILNAQGIPGIRYLDAGSRATGGTSNYVLFDDALAQIIKRNGVPVGLLGQ